VRVVQVHPVAAAAQVGRVQQHGAHALLGPVHDDEQ